MAKIDEEIQYVMQIQYGSKWQDSTGYSFKTLKDAKEAKASYLSWAAARPARLVKRTMVEETIDD